MQYFYQMKFFNLHTHNFSDNSNIVEVVNQYPSQFDATNPYFSVGIHPWHIKVNTIDEEMVLLEKQLRNPKCLAIGECGLDKRIEISLEIQTAVFKRQLLIAQNYSKPVIIHCVAAFNEIIAIKKELKISVPTIIHGYSKNIEIAKTLLNNDFYISFGKYLLLNPDLKNVFIQIPDEKLFLETDTVQESIEEIYTLAANYKNISVNELQQIINTNVSTVFGITY